LFITGLGILGLTSFMIAQRTKELSIRKVLGAGVPGILNLFARDFFRLILISFVIALPLSVFGLSRWLESFALRARLTPELFAVPLAAALLMAGGVIGALVLRTALSNPSKSLRCE
jgi:putative ABC transport system permease protein